MDIDNMDNSTVIFFFNNIVLNQNKNKLSRSARKIYIDNESYLRVTNNINEYCQVLYTAGSGYSLWFYFNSSIDGIGFIIHSYKNWNWQKITDNSIIEVIENFKL
jgi:hypothetical protein